MVAMSSEILAAVICGVCGSSRSLGVRLGQEGKLPAALCLPRLQCLSLRLGMSNNMRGVG